MTAKKRKTLAQRVTALEAEVRSLRKGVPESIVRQLQLFLDEERVRITDDVIYGRIKAEVYRMGEDIYDRLTRQRVTVTVHTEDAA